MKSFPVYQPSGSWVTTVKAVDAQSALVEAKQYAYVLRGKNLVVYDETGLCVGVVRYPPETTTARLPWWRRILEFFQIARGAQ